LARAARSARPAEHGIVVAVGDRALWPHDLSPDESRLISERAHAADAYFEQLAER
jgi:hypothetical protein